MVREVGTPLRLLQGGFPASCEGIAGKMSVMVVVELSEGTQDQVCVPLLPISWKRSPHLQVTRADPWVRGAGALGEMPLSASGLTRADHCIDDITCKLWSPLRSMALLEHAFVHERLENLARVSGNVS